MNLRNKLTILLYGILLAGMFTAFAPAEYQSAVFFTIFGLSLITSFSMPKGVLSMGVPAAATGQYTQEYVSLQGINMQQFYPVLVRKFGDQGIEFIGMMQALAWSADMAVQLIQHWEDDWIWDNFAVMAQAGGGTTATLTISPTSINTQGNFFPGVKDLIEFPNKDAFGNYIQAYVTAIGANTITVQVVKPSLGWTVPATTDGEELFITTNASAEGTGQPTPKVSTFNLYQNNFGIVKTTVDWTGSEETDTYWFDEYEGKKINGVVDLGTMQLDYRQLAAEQGMMLSGFKYENLTDSGKTVNGTEGMFATMNRTSIQYAYTMWGVSAFDVINKSLSKVYAGNVTGCMFGIDLMTTTNSELADYFKHTNVDYVTKMSNGQLFGDDEDLAMSVNFDYIKFHSKRVFSFKEFSSLNNPKTYGGNNYDYTRRGFMFPMKNDNLDVKSKAKIPAMRSVYRAKNGYRRVKEMFWTGSANAAVYGNTNDIDSRELNCRTEFGYEAFASNQWVNIRPTN